MFNVDCCKLNDRGSLKFFSGMLLNGHPGSFAFFSGQLPEKGDSISWGNVTSIETVVVTVVLLSFLCNYGKLTLKLHQAANLMKDSILLADSN